MSGQTGLTEPSVLNIIHHYTKQKSWHLKYEALSLNSFSAFVISDDVKERREEKGQVVRVND